VALVEEEQVPVPEGSDRRRVTIPVQLPVSVRAQVRGWVGRAFSAPSQTSHWELPVPVPAPVLVPIRQTSHWELPVPVPAPALVPIRQTSRWGLLVEQHRRHRWNHQTGSQLLVLAMLLLLLLLLLVAAQQAQEEAAVVVLVAAQERWEPRARLLAGVDQEGALKRVKALAPGKGPCKM
jgi:hypothetical protein